MSRQLTLQCLAVAAICTTIYFSTRAPAEAKKAPRPRLGIVSLNTVIKKYERYKDLQGDVKATAKRAQKKIEMLKAELKPLKEELLDNPAEEKKTVLRKRIRELEGEIKAFDGEARRSLAKKGNDGLINIYQDIREAVKRYALAHDLDLILQSEEGAKKEEADASQSILQKLNSKGCTPMFWRDGVDISEQLAKELNANYRSTCDKK